MKKKCHEFLRGWINKLKREMDPSFLVYITKIERETDRDDENDVPA